MFNCIWILMNLTLEQQYTSAYTANTMPADALATLGASASGGMVHVSTPIVGIFHFSIWRVNRQNGLGIKFTIQAVNSSGPSDNIWQHWSRPTMAQVLACHYLNQCWLIISNVQRHSSQGDFTKEPQPSITKISLEIIHLKFHSYLPGADE